ncbi:MAG: TIGR01212 family radical SAM protein [Tannerella sp.]|nr:TIGR01212 family radical SAM protein [Tannerella sp.]
MVQTKAYYDFSDFLSKRFPFKVQKITVNGGFTCPNRDGSIGYGGCTYCNNQTFHPDYCDPAKGISVQLEEGIHFFARKYPEMKYLAYFQAYTNTYGSFRRLKSKYEEALAYPGVVGLIIGTRPDCMTDELLEYLSEKNKHHFILLEYGVESTSDTTLKRINRGHSFQSAIHTIRQTAQKGIPNGIHLILGLPGEDRAQMLSHADVISQLPVNTLKLHQLQIIRHTAMAKEYAEHPERFRLFTPEDYASLIVDFAERLRPDIAIDRFTSQSPKELLIAPDWGMKNFEFTTFVHREFAKRKTCQGARYS